MMFTYVKSPWASITTQKIPSILTYAAKVIIITGGKSPIFRYIEGQLM
jgi:hypothetical protein